ncbi:Wadjet anti-phage system protein JetA family protein [Paenibacillus hamazuiensis]|uniref:Wadjet anti-phage system protein JetA family protein n=1 Tax=Paenibacillus hamazuiensis TaxID=2936508 RepID=UPI00200FDC77|nr:Wadjet anti-phage system protein JetA family protein [Paenibacillus hamazuiensis]
MTMKLFDVIPEGLFQLLSGPNKRIYAEALLLLFDHAQTERFGIRYEVMRDLLQEMLETYKELGDDLAVTDEEGQDAAPERDQLSLEDITRAQAGAVLRRLERLRWIGVETRSQFERFIVLPHYAIRIIGVLKELCDAKTVEYQRFAFLIYQSLTGDAAKHQPCSAVLGAADVSGQFRQELVSLYNNMKHHMEQVVRQTSIQDVLDHHFDHYKSQIIDKSYHRLKTSDHVARYRMQILNTVQMWLLDRDQLEEAALDGVTSGMFPSQEEAEHAVRQALFFIEDTFTGLEELFYQIDVRHNQYLRSSYDRARYLSQQNEGTDRQLARVLELIGKRHDAKDWGRLFALRQVRGVSEQSMFSPRRKRAPHQPDVHVKVDVPEDVLAELRSYNRERMRKAITRKKVDDYVLGRMGDRAEMEMEELAPQTAEQFIMLGYVYLYGSDGGSGFRIKRSETRRILEIGGYRFDGHTIVRKEGSGRR